MGAGRLFQRPAQGFEPGSPAQKTDRPAPAPDRSPTGVGLLGNEMLSLQIVRGLSVDTVSRVVSTEDHTILLVLCCVTNPTLPSKSTKLEDAALERLIRICLVSKLCL